MYAFTSGKTFIIAPIPQDIADKREKAEKREEKQKEAATTDAPVPKRKTNKSTLLKKITAQLEGISIAEKLILQLVTSGLGSLDKKALQTADEQAKQLGNYFIPGIQSALREFTQQFRSDLEREKVYAVGMEQLTTMHALIKKSKEYLNGRLDNPDLTIDGETTLEEWIGHAWQIAELRELSRVRNDIELLQLSFRSYTNPARGELIDEGYWADLQSGQIHITRTYRPFRAAKYIREEDSVFQVARAKELAIYPGELNTRVRFEEAAYREARTHDYMNVQQAASKSYTDVIKQVKNLIKNPLSDKHPVVLLQYAEIKKTESYFVLIDEQGKQLPLADIPYLNAPTTSLLTMLTKPHLENQSMLVMFEHNWTHNRLEAQPLSIISANEVIRLLY